MKPVKDNKAEEFSDEDETDENSELLKTGSQKQANVLTVLFAIRTEVLNSQKKINEIRRNQEESTKKVDEVVRKVDKVHEKLLEPDKGLFSRVRDLEMKTDIFKSKEKELETAITHVNKLVDWKSGFGKISWYVGFTLAGILFKYIFDMWVTKK